jgi:hypothetical protein
MMKLDGLEKRYLQNLQDGSHLTDNDGVIRGKVHTLMVFLEMDCHGGELGFYSPKKEFIDSFGESKNSKNKVKVLMYDGGLYNNPLPITDGKRVVVTYQIRQDE